MKTKNLFIVSALVSVIFIVASCYKNNSSMNNIPTTNKITISSSGYSPASLSVATGSTITWTNNDNMVHTVTTADGSINSGDIAAGASYSKTFSAAGTFNYYDVHNKNMMGVLMVTTSGNGY
jgi:plastocyanin